MNKNKIHTKPLELSQADFFKISGGAKKDNSAPKPPPKSESEKVPDFLKPPLLDFWLLD